MSFLNFRFLFGYVCSVISLSSFATQSYAADTDSQASLDDELKYLQAESYVITASKILEHKDRSIATVSVITQEQIRQLGAKDLTDVLYTVPGMVTTQSTFGAKKISIRGITSEFSEKVLILLNGHPLDHNITNGGSEDIYDNIALDNVKRIEIVRGPGSLLYGANAFLGTINIITKNVSDQKGIEATATGGSYGTQQYNLYAANQFNDLKVTTNANVQATDGIHAQLGGNNNVDTNLAGHKYDFDLNLGYKEWRFNGHFAEKQTGSFASFSDAQVAYPGFNQALLNANNRHYQDYFFILGYQDMLTDNLKVDLKGYHNNFNFDNNIPFCSSGSCLPIQTTLYNPIYYNDGITNTKSGGEAQFDYNWFENNTLVVGFKGETQDQYDVKDLSGPSLYQLTPTSSPFAGNMHRTLASGFVQDVWDVLPNLKLSAGARYDHYSDFGNTYNPRIGFNWEFFDGYIFRYEYGTAFRAPTFGEIKGANSNLHGNSSLQPETISTNEAGFTITPLRDVTASATLFNSDINNLITLSNYMYQNSGSANIQGIEFESKYSYLEGSYLSVNLTSQKVVNALSDQIVPSHFGNVMLNHMIDKNYSFLTHVYIKGDQSPTGQASNNYVSGYALLNTTLQVKELIKNTQFSASVNNWLDTNYRDPAQFLQGNFPNPGRTVFIRADIKF